MFVADQHLEKMRQLPNFIATLDQSGGSTPKALGLYGIKESVWSNDEGIFTLVHEMRTHRYEPGLQRHFFLSTRNTEVGRRRWSTVVG